MLSIFATEIGHKKNHENIFGKIVHNSFFPWVSNDISTLNRINSQCNTFIIDLDHQLDQDSLTALQLIQYFMWTNHSSCQLTHDFGGVMMETPSVRSRIVGLDGQKAVCIDNLVAPEPENCLVYSFGIQDDWSFDEQMELYGCEVFAFDPSIGMEQHDHSHRIHFFNWGLGDGDKFDNKLNWTLRSLSSIYNTLSEKHGLKIIDYLKIDIESSEWMVLPQIIESGMLNSVRQLGVEIHLNNAHGIDQLRKWAKILRSVEKMGMIRFDSKSNQWFIGNLEKLATEVSLGYEIAWYNNNLITDSSKKF